LLTWWRGNRKDAYARITEATQKLIDSQNATIQKQGDRILQLEGAQGVLATQMSQAFIEAANTRSDLAVALTKLETANATIARLQGEVDEWERRWSARFPEEQV
jgi:hypothetical protein